MEYCIAVVQACGDKGMDDAFQRTLIQEPLHFGDAVKLAEGTATDVGDMSLHAQGRVHGYTDVLGSG